MFSAIPECASLASNTVSKIAEMVTKASDITNILSKISAIKMNIPKMPSINGISISPPKISMPSLPSFVNPLDSISISGFSCKLDLCHFDFGIFGSILKALMAAVSMIIKAAIGAIVSAVRKCINMFLIISETISKIMKWMKDLKDIIWKKMKEYYNTCVNTIHNIKKQINAAGDTPIDPSKLNGLKILKTLWESIIKWFNSLMKTIGGIIKELEIKVMAFITALLDAVEIFKTFIKKIGQYIAEIAEDLNCIMKILTIVMG